MRIARLAAATLALACAPLACAQAGAVQEGERIVTGASRVEVRANRHTLVVARASEVAIEELRAGSVRAQVLRGTVILHVAALPDGEDLELRTANLAMRPATPGRYRIDVDDARSVTQVSVLRGRATVHGARGESRSLGPADRGTFAGQALVRAAAIRPAEDSRRDQEDWLREQQGLPPLPRPEQDRASRNLG